MRRNGGAHLREARVLHWCRAEREMEQLPDRCGRLFCIDDVRFHCTLGRRWVWDTFSALGNANAHYSIGFLVRSAAPHVVEDQTTVAWRGRAGLLPPTSWPVDRTGRLKSHARRIIPSREVRFRLKCERRQCHLRYCKFQHQLQRFRQDAADESDADMRHHERHRNSSANSNNYQYFGDVHDQSAAFRVRH